MKKDPPVFTPLFISYMSVILAVRGAFFIIGKLRLPEPQVQVNGVHIHHYLFGIAILFLVAIAAINQKFSKKTLSILLGISLAMIIDEFQFLVKLAEVKYPVQELDTISLVGVLLLLTAIIEKYPLRKRLVIPKFGLISKIAINIAFWVAIFGGLFGIKPIRAEMIERRRAISHYIPHLHMYYNQQPAKYHVPK